MGKRVIKQIHKTNFRKYQDYFTLIQVIAKRNDYRKAYQALDRAMGIYDHTPTPENKEKLNRAERKESRLKKEYLQAREEGKRTLPRTKWMKKQL